MKNFLIKILLFSLLLAGFIAMLVFKGPTNPESYNQAYALKKCLLENTQSPRIILVGGSSVAFGFDSKMLEDSLGIKVINTGLHADIGLKFMLDDISDYAKPTDIILICPEYHQFFGKLAYGGLPLADILTGIAPSKISKLNLKQDIVLLSNLSGCLKSRLQYNFFSAVSHRDTFLAGTLYSIHGFNSYGDVTGHWDTPNASYGQLQYINDSLNPSSIFHLVEQIDALKKKHCQVFLFPPVVASSSYENIKDNINEIYQFCKEQGLSFIAPAEHYVMADTLCFDTPYHLTKTGAAARTQLIINDLKEHMNQ